MRKYLLFVCFLLGSLLMGPFVVLSSDAPVTIEVWSTVYWSPGKEAVEQAVAQFMRTHPSIKVNLVFGEWTALQEQLIAASVGGVAPDVFHVNRHESATLVNGGLLCALDTYIEQEENGFLDRYLQVTVESLTFGGKTYGLPEATDVRALMYNTELFGEAGLDINGPPSTWKEMQDTVGKLTEEASDGRYEQMGFVPYADENRWLYIWAWQKGGELIDYRNQKVTLDSAQNIEALRFLTSFTERFGPERTREFWQQHGHLTWFNGVLGMTVGGDWYLPYIQQNHPSLQFAIADIPIPEDGQKVSLGGGFGWTIPSGAQYPDAAWEFIKWWTGVEGATAYFINGRLSGVPANLDFMPTYYEYAVAEFGQSYGDMLNMSSYLRLFPSFAASKTMQQEVFNAVTDALDMIKTPDAALREANEVVQRDWDSIQKGN